VGLGELGADSAPAETAADIKRIGGPFWGEKSERKRVREVRGKGREKGERSERKRGERSKRRQREERERKPERKRRRKCASPQVSKRACGVGVSGAANK